MQMINRLNMQIKQIYLIKWIYLMNLFDKFIWSFNLIKYIK